VRDMDHRELLGRITVPTLIIAGRHDPATTLENAEYVHAHIPGSRLAVLEAAHIANIEQPQIYAATVIEFLSAQ
jgi:3-oxoadipate enol-lactonase